MTTGQPQKINLPSPSLTGGLPLVEAISLRRSVRDFLPDPIQLFQLSQILWAAQGITFTFGRKRAVPSAGATYPLEVYAVIGENAAEQLESGVYHYAVDSHTLSCSFSGDIRTELSGAALSQDSISMAPVSLIVSAIYDNTLIRYNVRGERYVFMEVGHTGQNIYLQATGLGLATVAIGAFRDEEVRRVLRLEPNVRPLYIMPLGKPVPE
jgi:SagB-type dehydrogenase family enzyme